MFRTALSLSSCSMNSDVTAVTLNVCVVVVSDTSFFSAQFKNVATDETAIVPLLRSDTDSTAGTVSNNMTAVDVDAAI